MGNSCNRADDAPPIPPKPHLYVNKPPITSLRPSPSYDYFFTKISEQLYDVVDIAERLGEPKTIGELVNEFRSSLPLCLSVNESLYGICGEGSLMEGQLLSVHFLKEMKVLVVQAQNTGVEYNLPLSSTVEASILYDPNDRPLQARQGFTFNKVSDLINARPLPKVVCVLTAFTDMEGNFVKVGDILYVKELFEDENTQYLVCSNIHTEKSLKIDSNCNGKFTTVPDKIRMSLSKIYELVKLPVDITVSSPADKSIVLPGSATNCVYTITKQKEEQSVIVSTKYITNEDPSNCSVDTIEIFLSVPIEVQLVNLPTHERENLMKEAKSMYDHFQSTRVSKVICDLDSSTNVVQTELYKAIKKDSTSNEITLHRPMVASSVYDNLASNENIDEEEYVEMDNIDWTKKSEKSNTLPLPRRVIPEMQNSPEVLQKPSQSLGTSQYPYISPVNLKKKRPTSSSPQTQRLRQLPDTQAKIAPYLVARRNPDEGDSDSVIHDYDYVKFSKEHDREVQALVRQVQLLESKNYQLTEKMNEYGTSPKPHVHDDDEKARNARTAEQNKQTLSKYSCEQILEILGTLGLSQYSETFKKEGIDGPIFAELDDQVLAELGITGKLHTLKIMRLLDGRQSLESLNYT